MKKYVCKICGYVYDPENNNGVAFEDLPDDWTCPMCGVGKDQFEECNHLTASTKNQTIRTIQAIKQSNNDCPGLSARKEQKNG